VLELVLPQLGAQGVEIILLMFAEPPGYAQAAGLSRRLTAQNAIRVYQNVQSLFETDAREVADRERRAVARRARYAMPPEVQTRINHVDALARDPEIVRHEIRIVAAGRDEAVNRPAVLADQRQRLVAVHVG